MASVLRVWFFLLFWLIYSVFSSNALASNHPPKAVNGILDLKDWDFEDDGLVILNGHWEFYWDQLLEPDEFKQLESSEHTRFINIPGKWNQSAAGHEGLASVGYGTYRLKILLPDKQQRLLLRLEPVNSAYRLFLNGEQRAQRGIVGIREAATAADYSNCFVEYHSDSSVLEVVIQVSNFRHREGGILYPIRLGDQQSITKLRDFRFGAVLFSSGALIIMGIFHLFVYFTRKKDISPLYFGLICFNTAVRLSAQSTYLWDLFPSATWDVRLGTDYTTYFLFFLLMCLFVHSIFRETFSTKVLLVFVALFFPLALAALTLPASWVTHTIPIAQFIVLFSFIYIVYVLIRSVIRKLEGSLIFLFGGGVLFSTVLNDILFHSGVIQTIPLATFGLVFFMVTQAFLLSIKSSNAFSKNEKLTASYERFVPQEFLKQLGKKEIMDVKLGDCVEVKQMSILFSDIRSFTTLSESMTPEENFQFLNAYLKNMEPSITYHNGVVDKFIGDAIMALFPQNADDALKAAISMHQALAQFNAERAQNGLTPINIGIGINTGPMMLGTVGADNRMEGTVISDAVNLAARLEGMTKHYGAAVLISDNTLDNLSNVDAFSIRMADKVIVKGKTEPVTVWEVFDGDSDDIVEAKKSSIAEFEQGIQHYYNKQFNLAIDCFASCVAKYPEDKIAATYLTRSKRSLDMELDDNWDGVERLETK